MASNKKIPEYIKVLDWIDDHPQLAEDFKTHFGISPEEVLLIGLSDTWCTECKEYDHKTNSCPRFIRVIKETLEEVKNNADEDDSGYVG